METTEEKIKRILLHLGADACGIAGAEKFSGAPEGSRPSDILAGCRSVVVFARRLPEGLTRQSPMSVYNRANAAALADIERIGRLACAAVRQLGAEAFAVAGDAPYEYWTGRQPENGGFFSIRRAAVLAGLGCVGKNTLLMNKSLGNMMNIGALLTGLKLKTDPSAENICIEGCRVCIDACPQKALDGGLVDEERCRRHAYFVNARGFLQCGCSLCRVVCPRAYGLKDRAEPLP